MNERDKLVAADTTLKIVNKILDYTETLSKLSGEEIHKQSVYSAKEYLFASKVLKTIAEEILEDMPWLKSS